ncbi:DNA topoisomerase I [Proteiniborus ethanoligenes]|uniref:DNA topoisomerase 1 n=1 Tax=Proteiniborus ethanoligenes TaxID=415015 RepID=A0A1H3PNR8_9FIRM|nr:type I DNA topoisomerase [Proteiniborus ethanoligenes]TAH63832.1 MAG: type I DNA topoisomerase [Gottschalkiaceae bacterium]SDZ02601.1 DNA topoisomerase I [Proteiniborus ethanoligenes]
MAKDLVIVESPAKAKTISKFLGKNYEVKASVGHIRDLPKSKLGIDIDNNFEPQYITIRGKGPLIKELKSEAKKAKRIFLATDPDREGEAISWHLSNILELDETQKNRIEFHEITKNAIQNAIKKPRAINKSLVDAQQARRVLDRLVGYKISPLLWKKVRKGLSAGRVQSVATKLICDREKEIENFIPKEYWSIDAILMKNKSEFRANFYGIKNGEDDEKIELNTKEQVDEIISSIKDEKYIVEEIKKGKKNRNPHPPFTTSSLQQEASRRIGFSTKKTMMIAQQLYEGVDIKGEGTVGLVSYIRTDSTRISEEATNSVNEFIKSEFGESYLKSPNRNKPTNKKEAQDAHEAIRPTSVLRTPAMVKESLKKDQYKLYQLIWERFVASQMESALYETLSVKINVNNHIFRATGSKIVFDGFLKIYNTAENEKDVILPDIKVGEVLELSSLDPQQHFTQPPSRYTEASLVKTLEELGIGRPSTYAPTISTIISRGYVIIEKRSFKPTELGIIVTELLKEYFAGIVNEEFTAEMEEQLDKIEEENIDWKKVIEYFYKDFSKELEIAEKEISKIEIQDEETDIKCDKCGRNMVIKIGRYGKFLACPGYPECKNTKPITEEIGVKCPECGGEIIERKSKRGRKFYGCSNYPDCTFVSWDKPSQERCPKCNNILVEKKSRKGTEKKCLNDKCDYVSKEKDE